MGRIKNIFSKIGIVKLICKFDGHNFEYIKFTEGFIYILLFEIKTKIKIQL
jgi:hypothetical protein